MKVQSLNRCSNIAALRRWRMFASLSLTLGACTLDTSPETSPSRMSLQTDDATSEIVSSSLDTPREQPSVAGAAAPMQPSAAILPASPADEPEPEPDPKPPEPAAPEASAEERAPERACKPGSYEGVMAGTIHFGLFEVTTLTGKVSLILEADEDNEQLLRVQHGRVQGVDPNQSVFIANITGELDCESGELVQSEVERGMYADANEVLKVGFSGAAEGRYSADPPVLQGTWSIRDDSTLLAGQGTWTAALE